MLTVGTKGGGEAEAYGMLKDKVASCPPVLDI